MRDSVIAEVAAEPLRRPSSSAARIAEASFVRGVVRG